MTDGQVNWLILAIRDKSGIHEKDKKAYFKMMDAAHKRALDISLA